MGSHSSDQDGQASVWMILLGSIVVVVFCLCSLVAFTSWQRTTSITSCVQAGQSAETCGKALKP